VVLIGRDESPQWKCRGGYVVITIAASYAHRNRSMQIADGNNTVFYIKSIYLAHKRRQWERRKAESSIAFQHTPQRFAQPFRVSRIGVRICSRPAKKQCRSRSRKSSPGCFFSRNQLVPDEACSIWFRSDICSAKRRSCTVGMGGSCRSPHARA